MVVLPESLRLRNLFFGDKKSKQERVSIKNPETGELMVTENDKKKASLKYCIKLLTNKKQAIFIFFK